MRDGSDSAWARYSHFSVESALNNYRLTVAGFDPKSTAGDALSLHNGMEWSSPDQDHDTSVTNCGASLSSSWWFADCYSTNPLGLYSSGASSSSGNLFWEPWKSSSLDEIQFLI